MGNNAPNVGEHEPNLGLLREPVHNIDDYLIYRESVSVGDWWMSGDMCKVGKRGAVVIPAALRRRFGIEEGALLIVEAHEEGILLRPAVAMPLETYTAERRAEFLLSNAVDAEDYARAVQEVRKMGLDPESIQHYRHTGT